MGVVVGGEGVELEVCGGARMGGGHGRAEHGCVAAAADAAREVDVATMMVVVGVDARLWVEGGFGILIAWELCRSSRGREREGVYRGSAM